LTQIAEGENYLDGFVSPSIRSRRIDMRPCGVYATDKRIFLVRSSITVQIGYTVLWVITIIILLSGLVSDVLTLSSGRIMSDAGFWFLWVGLALLFIFIGLAWYRNFTKVPIEKLEKMKIWDIQRDQIASTEVMKRNLSYSEIEIHLKSGEKRSIFFSESGSFDRAKLLFSR